MEYYVGRTLQYPQKPCIGKLNVEGGKVSGLILRPAYGRVMCYPQYYLLYLWTCVFGMPGMVMLERKR